MILGMSLQRVCVCVHALSMLSTITYQPHSELWSNGYSSGSRGRPPGAQHCTQTTSYPQHLSQRTTLRIVVWIFLGIPWLTQGSFVCVRARVCVCMCVIGWRHPTPIDATYNAVLRWKVCSAWGGRRVAPGVQQADFSCSAGPRWLAGLLYVLPCPSPSSSPSQNKRRLGLLCIS